MKDLKVIEVDYSNPNVTRITGIVNNNKCPVCGEEVWTKDDVADHIMGRCKEGFVLLIKKEMEEIE